MKLMRKVLLVVMVLALGLAVAGPALAALDAFEAKLKIEEATITMKKFMTAPDQDAPRYLLKKAKAVVIVPNMVKAGFVVGGEYGVGVVSARQKDGSFGPPCFVTIGGGDIGFQIGAESIDLFLVVMSEKGLQGILDNSVKFGVDASVAAGPVGRSTEASLSDASLKADMYSYSQSQGAFAGVTIGGSGMVTDPKDNEAYYGKKLSVQEILYGGNVKITPEVQALMDVLNKFGK